MSSILKKIFIIGTLSLLMITVVHAMESHSYETDVLFDNYDYIEDVKLASSRYTKPDDLSLVDESHYIDIDTDDVLIQENDQFELYFNEDDIVFKVRNKDTNYVWCSIIENASAGTFSGLLESSLGFEYILVQKDMYLEQNVGISDTVYEAVTEPIQNGVRVNLNIGGYCSTRRCKQLYPLYLEGRYTLEEMQDIGFKLLDFEFALEVKLTDSGITAEVPYDSIVEGNPEEMVLSSFIIFPGLGATYMEDIPGYMFIPDGAGALIRYEDNQGQFLTGFEEYFYGDNYGIADLSISAINYPLSMPVFGSVHGVNQNAFIGIIESGATSSRLIVYPNGALNLPYNLIYTKFDLKQVYRQSFNSDGSGGVMKYLDVNFSDMALRYDFLENDQANYVGMANDYRNYLDLEQKTEPGDIRIRLDYLMSDSETSFFGSSLVPMSTVSEVYTMYDYFIENLVTKQLVGLMGWNEGGYSGHLPSSLNYENRLGSNVKFRELIDHINMDNRVMLYNNYVFTNPSAKGINYRADVAEGSNRFKLEWERRDGVYLTNYILYPEASMNLAMDHYEDYVDDGVEVALTSLANNLFSYYDQANYGRHDALDYYMDIYEQYDGIANYAYPFSYAFQYTNAYLEAPLYNSQLKYYDDVVPFLQIVLKGTIDMYASFLNFNSFGRETLLNLIDFGMNPSYILTHEPSSELKDTDVAGFFTTEFDLWKDTIVEEYNYINDALKLVSTSSIVSRTVLDYGVVVVGYSNGVDIYINYSSSDYLVGATDIIIPAMDYYVGGVS